MQLFPIFSDLKNRRVLVVGGGDVAARKVHALLAAQASVVVGALELNAELTGLAASGHIEYLSGPFTADWLEATWLIIAATDDAKINAAVFQAACARQRFCNVVDDASQSSFQVPAIIDRTPVIVAVSSSGAAPVLARRLREQLEALFDQSLGSLAALAARYRQRIRTAYPDLPQRRRFYDWLLDGPVATALRAARPSIAEKTLRHHLNQHRAPVVGRVSLVGAGPGDPGLLTLKALRALNEADIILYDRLVSTEILTLARRDAERLCVGKHLGADHQATQAQIHTLMVAQARAGKHVVRLKGGDVFIFGRGGEELEYLRAHHVNVEVIPGITAALACAAYAGIPLTHRQHAQSLRLVTAHCRDDEDTLDWKGLARDKQTLAFYMGVGQFDTLATRLIAHGRAPTTAIAIVENGSRPEQRVVTGTLDQLARLAQAHAIVAPALLIVGEVAALADQLSWFGRHYQGMPNPALAA